METTAFEVRNALEISRKVEIKGYGKDSHHLARIPEYLVVFSLYGVIKYRRVDVVFV